jgi:hypothetical protein
VWALCGTVVLAAFIAAVLLDFSSRRTANTEAPIQGSQATSATTAAPIEGSSHTASATADAGSIDAPQMAAMGDGGVSTDVAIVDASSDLSPLPQPETPAEQTASADTPDPGQGEAKEVANVDVSLDASAPPQSEAPAEQIGSTDMADPVQANATAATAVAAWTDLAALLQPDAPVAQIALANIPDPVQSDARTEARSLEAPDECPAVDICVDQYLWSVYQRAPKQDTTKVREKIKATVQKKGKTRTVTKTIIKLVDNDFTWKDPKAAERVGMSLKDYVIGGMDRSFKLKLYRALRAMDDAGLSPGITSAFRDDYRQAIASGQKAASDSSYHGGSRRGGYGHGLAADLVGVKGETRDERWRASEVLWKWIDAHGAEYGIGRPYLNRDPPHVGPIDGKEYADKRGGAHAKHAGVAKQRHRSAVRDDHRRTKRATTVSARAKST